MDIETPMYLDNYNRNEYNILCNVHIATYSNCNQKTQSKRLINYK